MDNQFAQAIADGVNIEYVLIFVHDFSLQAPNSQTHVLPIESNWHCFSVTPIVVHVAGFRAHTCG